ncbi:MAG: outer membrane lipoprotein-sorting protein [Natronospirillum sp.]|uniref:outer membrane lipoprotein-sorting protein n=1 Tax=Natronospirillum sp. TaxID=2812955 RepID=UPI0025DF72DB|nr:outer membrane lipoprotein-sorting protein [Natronospirillum sp.]MCH8550672.1 outer membrane lipoprotein-sorting protein [Natronospirillum sp.]
MTRANRFVHAIKRAGSPFLLLGLLIVATAAKADTSAESLLEHLDQLYQQDSAQATLRMEIINPDYERTLRLESWSLGMDFSLVRVLEPARDRGVSTLKRENEMWNYLPRVNRTVRVPPSMMMGSWMGSDFTNDDLMRDTSWAEEYDVSLSTTDTTYELTLVPREQTVTVWGRMEFSVDRDSLLPLEQRYFNERDELARIMTFSDVRDFNGRSLPSRLTLEPADKDDQRTTVIYESLAFDVDLTPDFFSLQNLRR